MIHDRDFFGNDWFLLEYLLQSLMVRGVLKISTLQLNKADKNSISVVRVEYGRLKVASVVYKPRIFARLHHTYLLSKEFTQYVAL